MKHCILKCLLGLGLIISGQQMTFAQDWKSIVSGVVEAVSDKKLSTKSFSLEGTWDYQAPDCKLESDNLLAKAGGEVAAKKVENHMAGIFTRLGFDKGCTYEFHSDSTYVSTVGGKTIHGTYSFNPETKELLLTTKFGLKLNAQVKCNLLEPNKISLLFNADKLMSLAKSVGGALGNQSSARASVTKLTALLNEYDGFRLGMELYRQ